MAVGLSEAEIGAYREALEYGRRNFAPNADSWEQEGVFPVDVFRLAASDGYVGLLVDPEFGGKGYSFVQTALIYQALARSCVPLTLAISTHSNIAYGISRLSDDPSVLGLVPSMVKGSSITTYAFTEEGAGSDPGSAATTATPTEGGYIVNGRKIWATLGSEARYIQLTVKSVGSSERGMISFLVDADSPGVRIGKNRQKTGANLLSTVDIEFADCFVPEDRVLSREGYRSALWGIGLARVFVGAISIGLCEEAVERTAEFLAGREQFGRPLLDNQGLRWKLADLTARMEAGRWLVYRAATIMDEEGKAPFESAAAKYYCANLAVEATDLCAHLHGGRGYCVGNPLERMAREARMLKIVDGTSEIQLEVIGKRIVDHSGGHASSR